MQNKEKMIFLSAAHLEEQAVARIREAEQLPPGEARQHALNNAAQLCSYPTLRRIGSHGGLFWVGHHRQMSCAVTGCTMFLSELHLRLFHLNLGTIRAYQNEPGDFEGSVARPAPPSNIRFGGVVRFIVRKIPG
jgi:hypothetical protein